MATKLLIHSDTTDGSTTFVDSSPSNHTVTPNGVVHEADQSKFGNTSIYFHGNAWLSILDSSDWDTGSDDFTIDFWVRRDRTSHFTQETLCAQNNNLGHVVSSGFVQIRIETNNTIRLRWFDSANNPYAIFSTATLSATNVFYHIAVVRHSDTLTLYIDGVAQATTQDLTGKTCFNSSNTLAFGRLGEYSSRYFLGFMDEIRYLKGEAAWTSNFTPPTAPYGSTSTSLSDMALDIAAYSLGLENQKIDISTLGEIAQDFLTDIHAAVEIREDKKLDLAAYFQELENQKIDISALGEVFKNLQADIHAAVEIREDKKLDIAACVQFMESMELALLAAMENTVDNVVLDLWISDGDSLQDSALDIEITDGIKLHDVGLDLAVVGVMPTFRAVYAMHLDSVIKEVV